VIDAVRDVAVAVKPNAAFFERYGPPGWDALAAVSRKAHEAGLCARLKTIQAGTGGRPHRCLARRLTRGR